MSAPCRGLSPWGFLAAMFLLTSASAGEALADYATGMEHYRKAWKSYEARRYAEAERWTGQATQADPANPHAQALAGNLRYLAHDLDGAAAFWRRALELEPRLRPLRERLDQLQAEQALEAGRQSGAAGPFVVRVPEGSPVDVDGLLEELSSAQRFLEGQLRFRLEGPVAVLVYDAAAFHGELHAPTDVAGLYDGKIRLPAGGGEGPSLRAVLWHELAHAAVHQLSEGRAPHWLHEGIAQVVTAQVEPVATADLRVALRADRSLEPEKLEGILFYEASWAYAQFALEHRGWEGLRRLLDGEAGSSAEEALADLLGTDAPALRRQWTRWAKQRLEGLDAPTP